MQTRYRLILPIVLGALSAILIVWDIHNQRVIEAMGMAWDTGAPPWPYQTPDALLLALNFPAYFLAIPSAHLLRLEDSARNITLLPSILVWWFLAGVFFDQRQAKINLRKSWFKASLLVLLAIVLLALGVDGLISPIRWWSTDGWKIFGAGDLIIDLRTVAPSIWCIALAVAALWSAKKRMKAFRPQTHG